MLVAVSPVDFVAAQDNLPTEIPTHVRSQRSKLRSLRVTYRNQVSVDEGARAAGYGQGGVVNEVTTIAFKGANRFYESEALLRDRATTSKQRTLSVFNKDECVVIEGKSITIQKDKSAYTESSAYLLALGFAFSARDREILKKGSFDHPFYPECLTHPAWRRDVADRSLVLFNPVTNTRLYIDMTRGYCLTRQERRNISKRVIENVADFDRFVEVGDGIWFPKLIKRVVQYAHPRTEKPAGYLQQVLEVTEISANDVPDELFLRPKFPPGSQVVDTIRKLTYFHDDTDDALDTSIKRTLVASKLAQRRFYKELFFAGFAVVGSIVLGRVSLRFLRKRERVP